MITNIQLPTNVPERMRTIDGVEKLENDHPEFSKAEVIARIRSLAATEEHLALCLEGKLAEARARAGSSLALEEIGETLAVLGDFEGALSISRDPLLQPFRQRGVLFVMAIEFFHRGHTGDSARVLAEIELSGVGAWARIQLALAFGAREPWDGYPFPDW